MKSLAAFRIPRALLVLAFALCISACGHSPTSPTPAHPSMGSTTTPAPPPVFVDRRVSGFVRDESSHPVAGASVVIDDGNGARYSVTTNANGFYDAVVSLRAGFIFPWYSVLVSKSGFEDTSNGAPFRTDTDTADFFLFKRARLTAGQAVELPLSFAGPLCGFEQEYACRHADVVAPADGRLTIEVTSIDSSLMAELGPVSYPPSHAARWAGRVTAGESLAVEILLAPSAPPLPTSFTLVTFTSRLDPES